MILFFCFVHPKYISGVWLHKHSVRDDGRWCWVHVYDTFEPGRRLLNAYDSLALLGGQSLCWWVLLVGLMRYFFMIAQRIYPALKRPLPPSFRRKLICVYQVVALLSLLLPFVVPPVSSVIAANALVLLTYSFATDVVFLVRADRAI